MNISRTDGAIRYNDIGHAIGSSCRPDITVAELRAAIDMVADEHSITLSDDEKGWALDIALANRDAQNAL